jgi:hypothetical protein
MTLRCTVQRFEVAIGMDHTSAKCGCGGLVFAPGWWCDDCTLCVFPTLLLDDDHEPNGDDEPDDEGV